jgi:hypothetical protein
MRLGEACEHCSASWPADEGVEMTETFTAGKPTLTTHPVIGGDALSFPITPPPPRLWWIHLRAHLHSHGVLKRPWDQEAQSSLIVESPNAANLGAVIDAVESAVELSNRDYNEDLALAGSAQEQQRADDERHARERAELEAAIAKRYPASS